MSEPDAALFVDIMIKCGGDFEAEMAKLIRDNSSSLSDSEVSHCVQAVTEDDLREADEGYLREDPEPVVAMYRKLREAGCGGLSD